MVLSPSMQRKRERERERERGETTPRPYTVESHATCLPTWIIRAAANRRRMTGGWLGLTTIPISLLCSAKIPWS